MYIDRIENFSGGWFIGDFENSILRTSQFEVCYKFHPKGEEWPNHYHIESTEYNVLLHGEMIINGTKLSDGDVFVIEPLEWANPEFITDCELIVVKVPSVPGDKYTEEEELDSYEFTEEDVDFFDFLDDEEEE